MDEVSLMLIGALIGIFFGLFSLYLYSMNEKLSDLKGMNEKLSDIKGMSEKLSDLKAELAEIKKLFESKN